MSIPAITLTKDAKMAEAKALMRDYRISGIPIIDERGHLIGIVSIENIIIALEKNQINEYVYQLKIIGRNESIPFFIYNHPISLGCVDFIE